MLALPEDAARGVLLGIKREKWEFSQYTGEGMDEYCGVIEKPLRYPGES